MADVIKIGARPPSGLAMMDQLQLYNALDCCITAEVLEALLPQLGPDTARIYNFSMAMQAPLLEMMLRGLPVDYYERAKMARTLGRQQMRSEAILNAIAHEVWGKPLNPRSPAQLKAFFFEAMNIPPIESFKKGERKVSLDREALEKLQAYTFAKLPSACIIAAREAGKKLGVLQSGIDADGRCRTSYNIGGTDTGRLSSSENAFGMGTNHQNITEELRRIFISPKGMKMAVIDKEQAESRIVGLLAWLTVGGRAYLDACESGDLHTTVAKMVWPDRPWPNNPSGDKALAKEIFYRHFSYRDMSKRGGHGTNYYGKPSTMAMHLKVETRVMTNFQHSYFGAFPEIPQWHQWTAATLQSKGVLTTPLGRRRQFFDRLGDDATLRKAIAYMPQSMQIDDINYGLYRAWTKGYPVEWAGQFHDAVGFFYWEEDEADVIPAICEDLVFQYEFRNRHGPGSRSFAIPVEPKVGWNWGDFDEEDNRDGLRVWKGEDTRSREVGPDTPLLDRRL